MPRYSEEIKEKVRHLRSQGNTYSEINNLLQLKLTKSTLSDWCKNVTLPQGYAEKVINLNVSNLINARIVALEVNKIKKAAFLNEIRQRNTPISQVIENAETAKIALAMLCLGEASKSGSKTSFYFGNSDPKIILLFLELLKKCFNFDMKKVRCTVQCRADQDIASLEEFWVEVTKIPMSLFYKTRVDIRTKGKPTRKKDYKGVLRVDYFDTKVRDELESLANLVYNRLLPGPVV